MMIPEFWVFLNDDNFTISNEQIAVSLIQTTPALRATPPHLSRELLLRPVTDE